VVVRLPRHRLNKQHNVVIKINISFVTQRRRLGGEGATEKTTRVVICIGNRVTQRRRRLGGEVAMEKTTRVIIHSVISFNIVTTPKTTVPTKTTTPQTPSSNQRLRARTAAHAAPGRNDGHQAVCEPDSFLSHARRRLARARARVRTLQSRCAAAHFTDAKTHVDDADGDGARVDRAAPRAAVGAVIALPFPPLLRRGHTIVIFILVIVVVVVVVVVVFVIVVVVVVFVIVVVARVVSALLRHSRGCGAPDSRRGRDRERGIRIRTPL
jgi:hypothetical protein